MEYGFVAEFELLRNSRSYQDITKNAWTRPAHREITTKYFKILRAHEEIVRVNIEMRRLRTSIHDEHIVFERQIARLQESDILLSAEVEGAYYFRSRVNATHTRHLDCIEALRGFTGICGAGTRRGDIPIDEPLAVPDDTMASRAEVSSTEQADGIWNDDGVRDDEVDRDEELEDQVIGLSEAISMEPSTQGVPNSMLFTWSLS